MRHFHKTLILLTILLSGLTAGLYLVSQSQIYQNRASFGPVCQENSAYCRWDSQATGVTYSYVILDETYQFEVAKGSTEGTIAKFTPLYNHQYRCTVMPVNSCGQGAIKSTESICALVATPTVTVPVPIITVPIGSPLTPTLSEATVSATPVASQSAAITSTPSASLVPEATNAATGVDNQNAAPTNTVTPPTPTVIVSIASPTPFTQRIAPWQRVDWWSRVSIYVAMLLVVGTVFFMVWWKLRKKHEIPKE